MNTRPHRPRSINRRVLLMLGALAAAPACEGGSGGSATEDPALVGATVGEVETLVADMPDGTSERQHFLNIAAPDGARLRLRFVGQVSGQPELSSGDRIGVWGDRTGDEFRVVRYALAPLPASAETVTSALIGAAAKPRTAVFVIVDLGGGSNVTNASATSTVFSPGNNFASVYDKLSFGIQKMSGDVQGPFSYPMTTCDYNGLKTAVKPMVTGTYQHYMWYFGSQVSACAWSGIGAEGNASKPQSDSWYNRSTGCTVLVQEVGHNMGWMHSSTLACTGATFADDPVTACKSSEYGNRMTPMGSGCGMLNGHDLWYGGFIGGCNGVKVTTSGTFNLFPLENACNAIQAIQIPMIKTGRMAKPEQGSNQPLKNYYLEYRTKTGLDASLTQGVYVYAGDDIKVATRTSNWSWLLDMNPSTTTFDGLAAGGSFTDPTGEIKVTVMSADTTKAVVQIDVQGGAGAAPTCIDTTTVEAPGPTDCGGSPTGTGGAGGTSGTGGTTGAGGRGGTTGSAGAGARGGTTGSAGAGGRGGTTGTAGTVGTMGSAGTTGAGTAGTTGSAGTTGAGTGGRGGTTGTAGTGMVGPGTAGTNGATGAAGTAGNPTGAAGAGIPTGAAGSPVTGTGGHTTPGEVTGGCACELGAGDRGGFGWTALGLGAAGLLIRRRRPPRQERPRSP